MIQAGLYEHVDGTRYIVVGMAHSAANGEAAVVYHKEGDEAIHWYEPVDRFLRREHDQNGEPRPKFRYIGAAAGEIQVRLECRDIGPMVEKMAEEKMAEEKMAEEKMAEEKMAEIISRFLRQSLAEHPHASTL